MEYTASKTFEVQKTLADVRSILSDMYQYVELHPLLYHCQVKDGAGEFTVKEKPFAGIPFSINYDVKVRAEESNIVFKLSRIPLNKVTLSFHLRTVATGTQVEFISKINGIFPITRVLSSKILAATVQVMDKIDEEL